MEQPLGKPLWASGLRALLLTVLDTMALASHRHVCSQQVRALGPGLSSNVNGLQTSASLLSKSLCEDGAGYAGSIAAASIFCLRNSPIYQFLLHAACHAIAAASGCFHAPPTDG